MQVIATARHEMAMERQEIAIVQREMMKAQRQTRGMSWKMKLQARRAQVLCRSCSGAVVWLAVPQECQSDCAIVL